jgi:hypothetical protein
MGCSNACAAASQVALAIDRDVTVDGDAARAVPLAQADLRRTEIRTTRKCRHEAMGRRCPGCSYSFNDSSKARARLPNRERADLSRLVQATRLSRPFGRLSLKTEA